MSGHGPVPTATTWCVAPISMPAACGLIVENGFDGRRFGRCAIALLLGCSRGRGGALEHFPKRDHLAASPLTCAQATPGPCFLTGSRCHQKADGHGLGRVSVRHGVSGPQVGPPEGPRDSFFRMSRSVRSSRFSFGAGRAPRARRWSARCGPACDRPRALDPLAERRLRQVEIARHGADTLAFVEHWRRPYDKEALLPALFHDAGSERGAGTRLQRRFPSGESRD